MVQHAHSTVAPAFIHRNSEWNDDLVSMMRGKKYTVLFIDDDTFLRDMYSVKFKERGLDVIACAGAQEALRVLEEGGKPEVIVLDMVMPAMDGLTFLKTLKAKALVPEAVRIVLSNQNDEPEMEKAKALGVEGYILKADTVPSQVVEEIITLADKALQKGA